MAVIWKDKQEIVGTGTVRDFIVGPFTEYPATDSKQVEVEKKLDRDENPYEKRDREITELRKEFFRLAGAKETDEITMDFSEETGQHIQYEVKDMPEKGWWIWEGEETAILFLDRERVGEFSTSCRGGMYYVEVWIGREHYQASERTDGKFKQ